MHPALIKLLLLRLKGFIRHQFSGGSVRRKVFGGLGLIAFVLWLGATAIGSSFQATFSEEHVLRFLPIYIVVLGLLPIVFGNEDRALAFTPAEVDFLFPGPFSRRQIVVYKLFKIILSSLFGGLVFSIWLHKFSSHYALCVLGAMLTLVFINLLSTAVALAREIAEDRVALWVRVGVIGVLLAAGGFAAWSVQTSTAPPGEVVRGLADHQLIRIVTAPARVFAQIFVVSSTSELAMWTAAGVGLNALMFGVVLAMDRGYIRAALGASQRRQDRLQRMSRGSAAAITPGKNLRSSPLPLFIGLGPAGAILRRQLLTALRTTRGILFLVVILAGYGLVLARVVPAEDHGSPKSLAMYLPAIMILLMVLPQSLRYDFRSDLDHLDYLKSLPASPFSIAAAEVATPILLLCVLTWIVLGVASFAFKIEPSLLVMAMLGVLPVGVLTIGLENVVFLLLPTRVFAPGQASAQLSGRRILMMLARLALFGLGGGVVAAVGALCWWLTASVGATFAACWVAMFAVGVGVIGVVAWAFRGFDVSADTPA